MKIKYNNLKIDFIEKKSALIILSKGTRTHYLIHRLLLFHSISTHMTTEKECAWSEFHKKVKLKFSSLSLFWTLSLFGTESIRSQTKHICVVVPTDCQHTVHSNIAARRRFTKTAFKMCSWNAFVYSLCSAIFCQWGVL